VPSVSCREGAEEADEVLDLLTSTVTKMSWETGFESVAQDEEGGWSQKYRRKVCK